MWCIFLRFVTLQYSVLGQVWNLIVLIHNLCLLPYFNTEMVPRRYFFCGSFLLVMRHVGLCCRVCPCSLVVNCWEMADLLAVVCVVFSCVLSLSQMFPGPHQN